MRNYDHRFDVNRNFQAVVSSNNEGSGNNNNGGEIVEADGDVLVKVETKPKLKKPSFYKVILLNDDFTPMDFVVYVLKNIFRKSQEEAASIMLEIHNKGKGICGIFTRDVAETKAEQVIQYAKLHEHPLGCILEKD